MAILVDKEVNYATASELEIRGLQLTWLKLVGLHKILYFIVLYGIPSDQQP